ncbi:MAG: VOC family protein [Candidatus Eremiobacteraeota bacterium]|nr:VOC family protein [Candidatus Eremiobacteraeota bacterium]
MPARGFHSVTPRLFCSDPQGLVAFLKHVFDAAGEYEEGRPAEMTIGDSIVMVSGTEARAATHSCLYVYVDDVDATYRRAIGAGATGLEEPAEMPWGDRRAIVADPYGTDWQIAARD